MNQNLKNSSDLAASLMSSEDSMSLGAGRLDFFAEVQYKEISPNPFHNVRNNSHGVKAVHLPAMEKTYEDNKKKLNRYNSDLKYLNEEITNQKANSDPLYKATAIRLKEVTEKRDKLVKEQENLAQKISSFDPDASTEHQEMVNPGSPSPDQNQREVQDLAAELKRRKAELRTQKAEEERRRKKNWKRSIDAFGLAVRPSQVPYASSNA